MLYLILERHNLEKIQNQSSEKESVTKKNQNTQKKSKNKDQQIKGYSNSQILRHNIPLFIMFAVGIIIVGIFNIIGSILFAVYLPIGNYLFMTKICAFCPHYGNRSSLCGYGLITKHFTRRKNLHEFKSSFRRYVGVLFPFWFVPLIIGIYLLYVSFDWVVLILFIIFIVVAFVIVPFGSRSTSCKTCKHRDQCPWMSLSGK